MEEDWKEHLLQSEGIRSCFPGHAYKSLPSSSPINTYQGLCLKGNRKQYEESIRWTEEGMLLSKMCTTKSENPEHFTPSFHQTFFFIFSTRRSAETVHFKSIPIYFPIFTHIKEKDNWSCLLFFDCWGFLLWLVGWFWCGLFILLFFIFFVKHRSPKKVFLSKVLSNLVQFQ